MPREVMGRAHVSWEGCTEVDGGKLGGRGETRRMSLAEREKRVGTYKSHSRAGFQTTPKKGFTLRTEKQ